MPGTGRCDGQEQRGGRGVATSTARARPLLRLQPAGVGYSPSPRRSYRDSGRTPTLGWRSRQPSAPHAAHRPHPGHRTPSPGGSLISSRPLCPQQGRDELTAPRGPSDRPPARGHMQGPVAANCPARPVSSPASRGFGTGAMASAEDPQGLGVCVCARVCARTCVRERLRAAGGRC